MKTIFTFIPLAVVALWGSGCATGKEPVSQSLQREKTETPMAATVEETRDGRTVTTEATTQRVHHTEVIVD